MTDTFGENPYYYPEKCGLELIGELNDPNACYSFNMVVVWRRFESGRLYAAGDSGCSCPAPFEDYHDLASLAPIGSVDDLRGLISSQEVGCSPYNDNEKQDLLRKVEMILAGRPA